MVMLVNPCNNKKLRVDKYGFQVSFVDYNRITPNTNIMLSSRSWVMQSCSLSWMQWWSLASGTHRPTGAVCPSCTSITRQNT